MPKCDCAGQTCSCVIRAGAGASVTGAGTAKNPLIISLDSSEGGGGSWDAGDLKEVAHGSTPAGWLECLGQAVPRISYPTLFAAIGTSYGNGDGSTTFNLPNYAGRSRVGAGSGYVLGATGGQDTTTLAVGNLPAHRHTIPNHAHNFNHVHDKSHDHGQTGTESAVHAHVVKYAFNDNTETKASGGARRITSVGTGSESAVTGGESASHSHPVSPHSGYTGDASPAFTQEFPQTVTGLTGSGAAFSNLPPYRVVRVLIKT